MGGPGRVVARSGNARELVQPLAAQEAPDAVIGWARSAAEADARLRRPTGSLVSARRSARAGVPRVRGERGRRFFV